MDPGENKGMIIAQHGPESEQSAAVQHTYGLFCTSYTITNQNHYDSVAGMYYRFWGV